MNQALPNTCTNRLSRRILVFYTFFDLGLIFYATVGLNHGNFPSLYQYSEPRWILGFFFINFPYLISLGAIAVFASLPKLLDRFGGPWILGVVHFFFYVSALLFYHSFVKGQVSETDMSDLPFVIGPPIVLITTVVIFLFGWLGVGWKKRKLQRL